jgi:septal ring factor EnvC (AmiA/AmiB activator)
MSNKFPTIKERILYLLEIKGIVKDKFFTEVGMTYGNFTGSAKKTPLNSSAISNIFAKIPDVNLEWLLMGKGEMLKSASVKDPEGHSQESHLNIYEKFLKEKDEKIDILNREIGELMHEIKALKEKIRGLEIELARQKNTTDELRNTTGGMPGKQPGAMPPLPVQNSQGIEDKR